MKTITANFGGTVVRAEKYLGRYSVEAGALLWGDTPEANRFRKCLQSMEQLTGWSCNGGQTSLVNALSADWEPAHIFVALNLKQLARYFDGKGATFHDAGYLLWLLMREQGSAA